MRTVNLIKSEKRERESLWYTASLSLSSFPILALPACLIRFAFGDEPASNCLMSSQGTWATRPPCFRWLPVWRAPAGPIRVLRLLIIPCACQLQGQWTVPARLPFPPPPPHHPNPSSTTSAVNHNVKESHYLAALHFQFDINGKTDRCSLSI